jgi:tRNA-2-methylthio-N6-dimethylallyladenosine synthase
VQSGSTRILQAMRRRHTREEYLELVAAIRSASPDIQLSTDMIVGFPGETRDDFEDTLSLTREVQYHSMFSFKYSVRPNTLAAKRLTDDVSEAEKTARIVALQGLQREIQTRLHERAIGSTVDVLVDSVSRRREAELSGRTSGNTVVNFPSPDGPGSGSWIGRTVPVLVTRSGPHSLSGELASSRVNRKGHGDEAGHAD